MNLVFTKAKNISVWYSNNIIKKLKKNKVGSRKNLLRIEIQNIKLKKQEKKKFKIQQNKKESFFAKHKPDVALNFVGNLTLKYKNDFVKKKKLLRTSLSQPINVKKKIVNLLMKHGKKSKAYTILHQALQLVYVKNLFYKQKAKSNEKISQKLYVKNELKKKITNKKTAINVNQKTQKKNATEKNVQALFKHHKNMFNDNLPKFTKINGKTNTDSEKILQHITQINEDTKKTAHIYLPNKKPVLFFFRLKNFRYFLNWLKKRSLKKQLNKVQKLMLAFPNFSTNKKWCPEKINQKKQQMKKETSLPYFCSTNILSEKKNTKLNLNKFVSIRRKIKQSMFTENLLLKAIENVKPSVEVRSVKVAGRSYQVPAVISKNRQQILAIKWIIDFARKKQKISSNTFSECLALELFDALKNSGKVRQKRDFLHKQAESNRAYMRFKWW